MSQESKVRLVARQFGNSKVYGKKYMALQIR